MIGQVVYIHDTLCCPPPPPACSYLLSHTHPHCISHWPLAHVGAHQAALPLGLCTGRSSSLVAGPPGARMSPPSPSSLLTDVTCSWLVWAAQCETAAPSPQLLPSLPLFPPSVLGTGPPTPVAGAGARCLPLRAGGAGWGQAVQQKAQRLFAESPGATVPTSEGVCVCARAQRQQ